MHNRGHVRMGRGDLSVSQTEAALLTTVLARVWEVVHGSPDTR